MRAQGLEGGWIAFQARYTRKKHGLPAYLVFTKLNGVSTVIKNNHYDGSATPIRIAFTLHQF